MTDYIPFAIQADILKLLPPKSLMQFRSVSKTWKALIDSSKFITHYNIQPTRQDYLLVHYNYFEDGKPQFVTVVDDDTFPRHKVSLTSPTQDEWVRRRPTILGVSQGLFCLSHGNHRSPLKRSSIVIWNPCIRKYVTVVTTSNGNEVIGFGVRPDTSDPTLVKVNNSSGMFYHDTPTRPWELEVYSLSSGAWRSIPAIYQPCNTMILSRMQVTIDEFIYFRAVDWDSTGYGLNFIFSFDMTNEEMTRVSLPQSVKLARGCNLGISNLNGSLVVLETIEGGNTRAFGVWMMERGVSNSFTKLYTVNAPDASVSTLLGFRKNNEHVFSARYFFEVNDISVNERDDVKYVRINGKAYPYMETLLLLDQ